MNKNQNNPIKVKINNGDVSLEAEMSLEDFIKFTCATQQVTFDEKKKNIPISINMEKKEAIPEKKEAIPEKKEAIPEKKEAISWADISVEKEEENPMPPLKLAESQQNNYVAIAKTNAKAFVKKPFQKKVLNSPEHKHICETKFVCLFGDDCAHFNDPDRRERHLETNCHDDSHNKKCETCPKMIGKKAPFSYCLDCRDNHRKQFLCPSIDIDGHDYTYCNSKRDKNNPYCYYCYHLITPCKNGGLDVCKEKDCSFCAEQNEFFKFYGYYYQ